ncbi:MAG: hypothetical protein RL095_693 [Verrucomicrobiota bacterium]|jgi:hypothetical protein
MKRLFILALCAFTGLVGQAEPAKEETTLVFICAGQSNMDGRAPAAALKGPLAAFAKPQADVLIRFSSGGLKRTLREDKELKPLAPGCSDNDKKFGPELGFGRRIAEKFKGRKIVLVKVAEGGTNLHTQWNSKTQNGLYSRLLTNVRDTEAQIAKSGAKSELAGMIWMQGESDSGKTEGAYEKNLADFIASVRKDLKSEKLPFVIGEVCSANPEYSVIRAAQKAVAAKVPVCALASSEGLKTIDKHVHFDAAGQIELGKRFAEEISKLRNEKR